MTSSLHWTTQDLAMLPDKEGTRYEIIDGELYVAKQPHWHHQFVCGRLFRFLDEWSEQTGLGVANAAPGVIFDDDNDVVPDVVWISNERLQSSLDGAGHIHIAPELAIEVLSFGTANERRDRETKLDLYGRRGVEEYWIADWRQRQVEVYRREQGALHLIDTLGAADELRSPNLPGFAVLVGRLFAEPA